MCLLPAGMQSSGSFHHACSLDMQADAMTDEEREAFREHVAEELKTAAEECGHPVMHEFPAAELEAAGRPAVHTCLSLQACLVMCF